MNIERLELTHFGRFHHKTVLFTPGLNVVYGRNEAGKTTIHAFIRSMLFGISETGDTAALYKRYLPWDTPDAFCGKLWLTRGGITYRIERSFLTGSRSLALFDETNGQELVPAAKKLKELLSGLTQESYLNTICIEQMSGSDQPSLAKEVETVFVTTSQSKSVRVNVQEAKKRLIRRRDELKNTMFSGADEANQACEKQLADTRVRLSRLQQAKSVQEQLGEKYGERMTRTAEENDERLMNYERERDELRRRYEAARNAYDEHPPVKERDLRSVGFIWVVFLVVAIACAGTALYLYLSRGMASEQEMILITALCCVAFLCIIVSSVTLFAGQRRRSKAIAQAELLARLEKNYRRSYQAFEACRKRAPKDMTELVKELSEKKEKSEKEAQKLSRKLEEEEKRETSLVRRREKLLAKTRVNDSCREELEAIGIAYRTIQKVSGHIHDTFGNLLNTEASKLLAKVTDGKYDRIYIDPSMKVHLQTEEREIELASVSRGTIEQIYLCIRVAAAILLWQKEDMPFIFDDVFAYYDDERLEASMRMLKECGHQAIIFSCHTRENNAL